MYSMRYVNMFDFFLLFVSTGLTVCYSFCLFSLFYATILILFLLILWLKPNVIWCLIWLVYWLCLFLVVVLLCGW